MNIFCRRSFEADGAFWAQPLTHAVLPCLQLHTVGSAYTVHSNDLLCLQLHTKGSAYTVHSTDLLCLQLHTVGSAYTVHVADLLCLQLHTLGSAYTVHAADLLCLQLHTAGFPTVWVLQGFIYRRRFGRRCNLQIHGLAVKEKS